MPDHDWRAHGADAGHTQYSSLDQINTGNVSQLKVAWTYHAGDVREGRSQIQCNPLVVHAVLYATSPQLKVLALDAATGTRKWVFDPFISGADVSSLGVNRGLMTYHANVLPTWRRCAASTLIDRSTRSSPRRQRPQRDSPQIAGRRVGLHS